MTQISAYHQRKGREARARLLARSGTSQFRTPDLAAEIRRFMGAPYNWPKPVIAQALGITLRRLNQALRSVELIEAKGAQTQPVEERYARMLDWTVDAFVEFFETFSNEPYFPKHVRPWIAAFLRERNLLLNVPPRHAKSTFFMVWLPIWLIARDRNVQILLVSKTWDFAKNWATEIAGQLEGNQALISAYGRFAPENTREIKWMPYSGTFNVVGRTRKAKGAQYTVESRGMEGQVLGREADFVIVDDPTDRENSESETKRRRDMKHLQEQVFSRAEPQGDSPGGRIAVIGQRVHLLDLYGELEAQEYEIGPFKGQRVFHTEKYPAIVRWPERQDGSDAVLLWPERFSWEEMMIRYARAGGEHGFFCMYQQEPTSEGAAIFKPMWLDACKDPKRKAREGYRVQTGGFLPIVRVLSMDPSPSGYNGFIVGDLLCDRRGFHFAITEVYRKRAGVREAQALVDELISSARPDYFIYESSAVTKWLRDDPWFLALTSRVRVITHRTGVNKHSQEFGVQSLPGDFELGRISLPYGDDEGRAMTDLLVNEALVYPQGQTDDLLMALWFVKFNHKKLVPFRDLPTRVRGGDGGTWSFLESLARRGDPQEEAYRRWHKRKAEAEDDEDTRMVTVG